VNVVVVEDIHWADEATMDLLRFAGRRLRDTRVLLIVTFRDDDLATDDQLRVALGELARHRTTRRIALAPLSTDAVRALAGRSRLEAAALYQLTGGNPFYLTEADVTVDLTCRAAAMIVDPHRAWCQVRKH
jgi:predicted ATPase